MVLKLELISEFAEKIDVIDEVEGTQRASCLSLHTFSCPDLQKKDACSRFFLELFRQTQTLTHSPLFFSFFFYVGFACLSGSQ